MAIDNQWRKVKIADIAERVAMGPFGSNILISNFVSEGIPVISGQHLHESRLSENSFNYLTEQKADELRSANAFRGDVIFTHSGTIGQVSVIPQNSKYKRYVMSQRQFKLTCKPDEADPEFITYFFRSRIGQHLLKANSTPSGVPSIAQPVTYLKSIEIYLPPLPVQKEIAQILGAFDDKIELNRWMNETLEAMARALFKCWFVDFEPVRIKQAAREQGVDPNAALSRPASEGGLGLAPDIAALFPDRFVESELGEIPAGWEVVNLDDLTDFALGGDWGKDEQTTEFNCPCYCIRGADIPDLQAGGLGKMPIRYVKASSLEKRALKDGDLVVEISGGSPTQSTGRAVLIQQSLLRRLYFPLICSNFCRHVRLNSREASEFVYLWLRWLYSQEALLQYENGTTGIKNFAFAHFASVYPVVMPTKKVLQEFAKQAQSLLVFRQHSGLNAQKLAEARDLLLPELLSGNVELSSNTLGGHRQ